MKSKASFKSHPIHPILIVFPVAFLIGALLVDLVGLLFEYTHLFFTAYLLAVSGVVAGFMAAIPGLIDYVSVVPPNSSAKKRATYHMGVNSIALGVFIVSSYLREDDYSLQWWGILFEVSGVLLLSMGGWLGGTLVYRNQIGVDHRYMGAGKWRESNIDEPSDGTVRITVTGSDELKLNQMKLLKVGDRRIVLAKGTSGYFAFDDRCSHRGGSLAGGTMICDTVQCPWHGSQFSVKDGSVCGGPATSAISTYPVNEIGSTVEIRLT